MLKKLTAAVASLALALGMVALTAAPASAHSKSITATCTAVTVNLDNYDKDDTNKLEVWLDGTKVENIADFGDDHYEVYTFTNTSASSHTYRVKIDSSDNGWDHDTGTLSVGPCGPTDTSKLVPLCHNNNGASDYSTRDASAASILNGEAHGGNSGTHGGDIIPPFSYTENGVEKTYPGKNWNAAGQEIYNNGCAVPAPAEPTWVPGVCTGTGTASAGTATIPAAPWNVGVTYRYRINNGSWSNATAGQAINVPAGAEIDIEARKDGSTKKSWTFTATPTGAKCIDPATPTFTPKECVVGYPGSSTQAWYKVPSSPNFTYKVGATSLNSNQQYNVNSFPTTITIVAVADNGYTLVGETSWTFTFSAPANNCYGTPQTPQANYVDATCEAPGDPSGPTVTLFAATGIASYQLSVDGGAFAPFAGTLGVPFELPVGTSTVVVRPISAANYVTIADLPQHTFIQPDCIYDAVPDAKAIEPVCSSYQEQEPVLGPSYVRVYWNEGVASYHIEGYGTVNNPNDASLYTDVATGEPLETLTVTATAKFGYELTTNPLSVTFGPKVINQCGDGIIADPIATNQQCVRGQATGGSIWVERMEDLRYTISGGGLVDPIVIEGLGQPGDLYEDGTVPLPAGTYLVTPEAINGAVFAPDQPDNLPKEFTILAPEDGCVVEVPVLCELDEEGFLTLPLIDHVLWTVVLKSNPVPPLYDSVPGPVVLEVTEQALLISATAVSPYVFPNDMVSSWGIQLEGEDVDCGQLLTFPPIDTGITVTPATCASGKVAPATLTVGMVDGVSWFAESNYYLDGSATPMTQATVTLTAGPHTVTVEPKDPDDTIGEGFEDSWEFTVAAAPATCGDLTTLALTGSNSLGWAGIGYFLLVSGLALVAVRFARRSGQTAKQ